MPWKASRLATAERTSLPPWTTVAPAGWTRMTGMSRTPSVALLLVAVPKALLTVTE
jgi:hypothetical protein